MPFAEVVEALEVVGSFLKEFFERFCMMLGATNEMGGCPSLVVHGEVDDPKMVRCDLLTHEDAADFAPAGAPQVSAKPRSLLTWKADRDHRMLSA